MDAERFDELTKAMGRPVSRRSALRLLLAAVAGGALGIDAAARTARAAGSLGVELNNRQFIINELGHEIHGSGNGQITCDRPCHACETCQPDPLNPGKGVCTSACASACETCDAASGLCKNKCDPSKCEACNQSTGACESTCRGCNQTCTGNGQCSAPFCPSGECCYTSEFSGVGVCLSANQKCPTGDCCFGNCCTPSKPDCCPTGCANTSFDPHNCGLGLCVDCETTVGIGAICNGGVCACPNNGTVVNGQCQGTTSTTCNGQTCTGVSPRCCSNECVDTDSNINNCGGCSKPCVIQGTVCQGGTCVCESNGLPPAQTGGKCPGTCNTTSDCSGMGVGVKCCNHKCVDTSSDPNNCNGCGIVCPSDQDGQLTCCSGSCQNTTNNVGVTCGPTCQFCTGTTYCRSSNCTSCTDLDQSCTSDDECCSDFCYPVTNTCVAGTQPQGFPCHYNKECSSNVCVGTNCTDPSSNCTCGACLSSGTSCTSGTAYQCCSGICTTSGTCY